MFYAISTEFQPPYNGKIGILIVFSSHCFKKIAFKFFLIIVGIDTTASSGIQFGNLSRFTGFIDLPVSLARPV